MSSWLIVTVALGPLAGKLGEVENTSANAFLPGSAESAQVNTELERFSGENEIMPAVIPVVLAVVLLVLIWLLRSLVAPLLLLATVVLSYLGALGASHLVVEYVLGFAGVDRSVPLMGFVFLVALGIDYNIFLMTRVREEVAEHGHTKGVLAGLTSTGGVITSAGIVLAATFAVIASMPLVTMAQMGVLVGIGVLLDTFLVRTVLVPPPYGMTGHGRRREPDPPPGARMGSLRATARAQPTPRGTR